jgi:hypothetical protein
MADLLHPLLGSEDPYGRIAAAFGVLCSSVEIRFALEQGTESDYTVATAAVRGGSRALGHLFPGEDYSKPDARVQLRSAGLTPEAAVVNLVADAESRRAWLEYMSQPAQPRGDGVGADRVGGVASMASRAGNRHPLARVDAGVSLATYDEALEHFAAGKPTRDDVRALVAHAKLDMVQIHVRRTKPPIPGKPIRLMRKGGPYSSEDRAITKVPGVPGTWSAWWRIDDLKIWLDRHQQRTP